MKMNSLSILQLALFSCTKCLHVNTYMYHTHPPQLAVIIHYSPSLYNSTSTAVPARYLMVEHRSTHMTKPPIKTCTVFRTSCRTSGNKPVYQWRIQAYFRLIKTGQLRARAHNCPVLMNLKYAGSATVYRAKEYVARLINAHVQYVRTHIFK